MKIFYKINKKSKKIMKKYKIDLDLVCFLCYNVCECGVEQLVARQAHNLEAGGSSPSPATNIR